MKQSNALRTLEIILDEAVTKGEPSQSAGSILLKAMKLDAQPQSLVDFYELLNKAEEEARKLNNIPKINRYIQQRANKKHLRKGAKSPSSFEERCRK